MKDEQVRRYARHIMLPDVGGLGQTALMVSSARLQLRDADPEAELIAARYLAAGGVGTLVLPSSTDAQRTQIAAHGPDTKVVDADVSSKPAKEVVLSPRPVWWPTAEGDQVSLAFWRGSIAAALWMADAFSS